MYNIISRISVAAHLRGGESVPKFKVKASIGNEIITVTVKEEDKSKAINKACEMYNVDDIVDVKEVKKMSKKNKDELQSKAVADKVFKRKKYPYIISQKYRKNGGNVRIFI